MKRFRPWGHLSWMLNRLASVKSWSLLGCIGTEERSLAAWRALMAHSTIDECSMIRIHDSKSRFTPQCSANLTERTNRFVIEGGLESAVTDHFITAEHFKIVDAVDGFSAKAGKDIVVDITSMPKRFFFPILRLITKRPTSEVANIIVTYCLPESYTADHLAESFGDWAHLPLFTGAYTKEKTSHLIIGVGFEALGLLDRVETAEAGRRISFLLPFPAPVKAFQRSWELLRRLQEHQPPNSFSIHRVDMRDPSDAFDRLLSVTNRGTVASDLAPFGPKPMSLAMCLYASIFDCPVFYTQPTVYHPNYSTGVLRKGGIAEIYAYAIRIDGRDVYTV